MIIAHVQDMKKLTMSAVALLATLSAGTASPAYSLSDGEAIEYMVAHPEFGCEIAGNNCTEGWQGRLAACQREMAISERFTASMGRCLRFATTGIPARHGNPRNPRRQRPSRTPPRRLPARSIRSCGSPDVPRQDDARRLPASLDRALPTFERKPLI
jgi:hypothetical protein